MSNILGMMGHGPPSDDGPTLDGLLRGGAPAPGGGTADRPSMAPAPPAGGSFALGLNLGRSQSAAPETWGMGGAAARSSSRREPFEGAGLYGALGGGGGGGSRGGGVEPPPSSAGPGQSGRGRFFDESTEDGDGERQHGQAGHGIGLRRPASTGIIGRGGADDGDVNSILETLGLTTLESSGPGDSGNAGSGAGGMVMGAHSPNKKSIMEKIAESRGGTPFEENDSGSNSQGAGGVSVGSNGLLQPSQLGQPAASRQGSIGSGGGGAPVSAPPGMVATAAQFVPSGVAAAQQTSMRQQQKLFVNAAPYEPSGFNQQLGGPAGGGGLGQQGRGEVGQGFPYDQQQAALGQQQVGQQQQVYYQPQQAQYGQHIQQPQQMPHQPPVLQSPQHGGGQQQILYQNAAPAPAPQYVYDYQGNVVQAAAPPGGAAQPGQQMVHPQQQILLQQQSPHAGHPHQPQYISIVPLPGGGTAQVATAPPPTYAYVQYDAAGNVTAVPQPPQQATFVMGPNGVPIAVQGGLAVMNYALPAAQQPGSPLRSPHGGQGRYGSPHGGGYLPKTPRSGRKLSPRSGGRDGRQRSVPSPSKLGPEATHLLNEIRNAKSRNQWTIHDIQGHVVEFCLDQNGSRFIQQRLEVAQGEEKEAVMGEIVPNIRELQNDVFG